MLGSRGRTYLTILVLSVLFKGPIANIQKNVEAAAFSLSCNLDLQVHNGKLLWKHAIRPFILVTEELMGDQVEFESETRSISQKFQNLRDEMVLQYGYEGFKPPPGGGANSTQEQFDIRTKMQCDSLVNDGVQRCAGWFDSRWKACMAVIPVPVINHILCVSMKFHFLCDIMKVMTPWCREKIPVEGNFGQLFDQLNVSVDLLSREFSTKLVVQVRTASASCSPGLRSSRVLTGSPAGGAAAVRAGGSSAGPELHSGHQSVLPGTDEDHHTDAERPADAAVLHLHLHLHPGL
ncbi:DC-STAMP domain-containing protein 1 [Oryzias melastigma]|uniref:DC-STAMP domain-containing protein 1 n=1 Tax=Oryzias melastigma TaxID=30732 RepID=A0A834FNM2_ORYME|nr:DC-STAMP domain-containing protein 1 [Oryzias melastigma]